MSSLAQPAPCETPGVDACARCAIGVVVNDGVISPGTRPLRQVRGLGTVEPGAWEEVRSALAVSAWTAAVMLCRKLILHVAVAHGLPEKDKSGRAPSFDRAVKHLQSVGLITPPMKPWVDHIRKVGNGGSQARCTSMEGLFRDRRSRCTMGAWLAESSPTSGCVNSCAATTQTPRFAIFSRKKMALL